MTPWTGSPARSEPNPATGGWGGPATTYAYDLAGNLVSVTDGQGNVTSTTYDARNECLTETDASGTTSYTYDAMGNMLTLEDPDNNVTTWTYDHLGRVLTESELVALNTSTTAVAARSWTYDADGNVLQYIDADGRATVYTYLCPCQLAGGESFGRSPGRELEGRGCRGRGLVPLLARTMRAKPEDATAEPRPTLAGCLDTPDQFRVKRRSSMGCHLLNLAALRCSRHHVGRGDLLDKSSATGLRDGPLLARRKRPRGRKSLAAAHLGQGPDRAAAARQFGDGLRSLPGAARATLAGGLHSQARELRFRRARDGVAIGLAGGEHLPADHSQLPRRRHHRHVAVFFLRHRRRKKWPSGPGCLSRCCAASMSIQRACELPRLVIGPW